MARERLTNPDRHYAMIYPHHILSIWADTLGSKYFHLVDSMESSIFTDQYALAFKANSPLYPHFDRV